jgi:hypothetical protein
MFSSRCLAVGCYVVWSSLVTRCGCHLESGWGRQVTLYEVPVSNLLTAATAVLLGPLFRMLDVSLLSTWVTSAF